MYFLGADSEECCEETPLEGVFPLELGFEVRSVSIMGGFGDLEGLEWRDIVEGDLEDGKEEREVLRCGGMLPFELQVFLSAVPDVSFAMAGFIFF